MAATAHSTKTLATNRAAQKTALTTYEHEGSQVAGALGVFRLTDARLLLGLAEGLCRLNRAREAIRIASEADERWRTLFMVGDFKQAIYSFQGTDPASFEDMRQRTMGKAEALADEVERAWSA